MTLAVPAIPALRAHALGLSPSARDHVGRSAVLTLLLLAVGIEIAVLAAWLPDTLDVWWHPARAGYGDFPLFYRAAQSPHITATYSPGLVVLMRPLTYLSMEHAFWIYAAANVAATLGVAYIAQRAVRSPAAKAAVVLGILALPQTHWAIRVGHFTPVLALATLSGLLLAERRPVAAGLCIGILALKPQYLPVPLLYFAFTKNWRALFATGAMLGGLALAGVVAVAVRMGPDAVPYVASYYREIVPYTADNLTAGQQDGSYVHAWQYSWFGFLLSVGLDANPLVAADLIAVSAAAMLLAWWRCTRSVAKAAVVLGMLLVSPHVTFYNWTLVAAAAALLLHSDLRPRWLVAAIIVALVGALAASQNATPFPIPVDRFRPPETRGLYWVQPAALATLFLLAFVGKRHTTEAPEAPARPVVRIAATFALRAALAPVAAAAIAAGFIGAAWFTATGPFAHDALFSRQQVIGALPADFPAPDDATIGGAGSGSRLPYRIEWDAPAPVNEVAGIMRQRLDGGGWRIVDSTASASTQSMRAARGGADGRAPVVGEITVSPSGDGSAVRLEFSPLPASSVPGYRRWLQDIGLVLHDVAPGTEIPPATGR